MLKLKLRIFRPCRTKDTSTPPEKPPPPSQRHKVTAVDFTSPPPPPPPPSKQPPHRRRRSAFKAHLCSAFRCGCSTSGNHSASEEDLQSHLDSPRPKIYNSSAVAGVLYGQQQSETVSSSSGSFSSTDYNSPSNNCKVNKRGGEKGGGLSPEWGSPARLSVLMKLMPCKVKESFAVAKRSENPYEDFRKSMVEMIVEKEMVEESDLTQLLQCFLSLNSRYHHGVIMEAFSEIWDTMFLDQYRTF